MADLLHWILQICDILADLLQAMADSYMYLKICDIGRFAKIHFRF